MRILTFALSLVVSLASFPSNSQTTPQAREQTTFSESDSITNPVAVPPAVANLILDDPALQKLAHGETADKLFAGSEIHLGPTNEIHLVVIGVCPICGADNDWFWVIRSPYKNPQIIGSAGGSTFAFLSTKSQGYRDLESFWSSAAGMSDKNIYRFTGSEYERWKHSTRMPEQTFFSASIPFDHAVKVPEAVSNLIFSTDMAKPIVGKYASEAKHPDQFLEASEIHLGPNDEISLFVRGIGRLSGPNNAWTWIWIVRSPYKNPRILLYAGGDNFDFPGIKTHGYCDLVTDWENESGVRVGNIYRFNGVVYKLWKHRVGDINLPEP